MITPETYKALGLSDEEYQRILEVLEREPTPTELAMFSVEWSEHCGYMCSKPLISQLPKHGKYLTSIGEDSGAVFINDIAIVFKMESHNHPSEKSPFQGSATGVGGILRDIFTANARPIALLDSLRFGDLRDPYTKHLVREVVRGIAWYGNCVGVPTVGGEINFDPSYTGNCLVNVMSIGTCHKDKIASAKASGLGNSIMYVGSTTGRDGIGGCSVLASHSFLTEDISPPTVQVGDPFMEKCLIEATLEILKTDYVVGIKDMGAAGLTCSISEMAAAGDVGIEAILDFVPLREEGMEAWEIMMSESQERMLVCVRMGHEDEIKAIFDKWGLNAAVIGTVTDDGKVRISYQGEIVADVDAKKLTEPGTYSLPEVNPYADQPIPKFDFDQFPDLLNYNTALTTLLGSPNIASKRWVYEQYDHMVQTNTVTLPGRSDAAVIRLEGTNSAIAATIDCNSTFCRLDPKRGAMLAVLESATNLLCTGAEPIAVTNCLNFGDPTDPEVFWQLKQSVEGIAEGCKRMILPVVSGNVSLYNQNSEGAINPTPTIGMIGIIDDISQVVTQHFKQANAVIVLIEPHSMHVSGNGAYWNLVRGVEDRTVANPSFTDYTALKATMLTLIQDYAIQSAHDVSDGGLAVALAECCVSGNEPIGAGVSLKSEYFVRRDIALFNERPCRILVSCSLLAVEQIIKECQVNNLISTVLGVTGGDTLQITHDDQLVIDIATTELCKVWGSGLEKQL